jgi:exodeoxyribonuclease-5
MTTVGSSVLKDDAARRAAITAHGRSILVEAGAGSGKTAVMAGRIAMLLAQGAAPRSIAAVTFTELAASELLSRVREFVTELIAGHVANEMKIALPAGLSDTQRENLAKAAIAIDEITCSTIHGFCQRLIKPYPAEADIDPGAAIIDRTQGDLAFLEIVDAWLRERLSDDRGGLIAEMVLHDAKATVALVHLIAQSLRQRRGLSAPLAPGVGSLGAGFLRVVASFAAFQAGAPANEPDTASIVSAFRDLANDLATIDLATPAGLVRLLAMRPAQDLVTSKGTFRVYKKKARWEEAARSAGLSKADGGRLNTEATAHVVDCGDAWTALQQAAASRALAELIDETKPILERYRDYKRRSAQLDFDDLIFAARDLLRDHDDVRSALGARFERVLVDEFQDTDPLQTEILWRLCGDPPFANAKWADFRIRPGALFLVGDPKQAIYRFRGADVAAYIDARSAFVTHGPKSMISISTNFRSRSSILDFVNDRFKTILSVAAGQPGFTALDAFHIDPNGDVRVVTLDVKAADAQGNATAEQQRDAEAEAVAELCVRLIGHRQVIDRRNGQWRPCLPGDIALLAPTGKDLWRYEEALERRHIPVATQAGKGLFRRQEIQDLIALTRVLADRHDTLALGALLRGPLVGLTEEELLDILWALPRPPDAPDRIPDLNLAIDSKLVQHPFAVDVLMKLQSLYRRGNSTTPYVLLCEAVDVLRVRSILLERHSGQAERALANVDLYLSLATAYAVRGLQAFADAMAVAWADEERAVEGRPDAQEESVALFTMHAAKGLEWPIVIPINTMTRAHGPDSAVIDRTTDCFYCKILGVSPDGHEAVRDAEQDELTRERIRLWYVATTRARELLVLPRSDVRSDTSAWNALIDLALPELPAIDLGNMPTPNVVLSGAATNEQTREAFAAEASGIAHRQRHLEWNAPSRNKGGDGNVDTVDDEDIWAADAAQVTPTLNSPYAVQGGLERGLILHKIMEEILAGEIHDEPADVLTRAKELILALGKTPVVDPDTGLAPGELAACVAKTLAIPQIAALRPRLQAEFSVYGSRTDADGEMVTAGVVDAMTLRATGNPDVVVDWKSDVNASPSTIDHYRSQVEAYIDMSGAAEGLIVFMTSGHVIEVLPRPSRITS